jgi:hypothetical protein
VPASAGRRDSVAVHGTLWLVTNGIRSGKLTEAEAINIIDQLAATDMTLPTDGAGFLAWSRQEGLLP